MGTLKPRLQLVSGPVCNGPFEINPDCTWTKLVMMNSIYLYIVGVASSGMPRNEPS